MLAAKLSGAPPVKRSLSVQFSSESTSPKTPPAKSMSFSRGPLETHCTYQPLMRNVAVRGDAPFGMRVQEEGGLLEIVMLEPGGLAAQVSACALRSNPHLATCDSLCLVR